jgi:hypothetical protein
MGSATLSGYLQVQFAEYISRGESADKLLTLLTVEEPNLDLLQKEHYNSHRHFENRIEPLASTAIIIWTTNPNNVEAIVAEPHPDPDNRKVLRRPVNTIAQLITCYREFFPAVSTEMSFVEKLSIQLLSSFVFNEEGGLVGLVVESRPAESVTTSIFPITLTYHALNDWSHVPDDLIFQISSAIKT